MQQDQLGKSFGLVIAFLVPGMLGLYAMSLHVRMLQSWFEAAARAQTTLGGFLLIVIASSGMGVLLSGVRWYFLEERFKRSMSTDHDATQRREVQTELVYQNVKQQFYDFYLFYSNTLVALAVLWVSWIINQLPTLIEWPPSMVAFRVVAITVLGVVTSHVLYASAKDALDRYQKRRAAVLEIAPKSRETA